MADLITLKEKFGSAYKNDEDSVHLGLRRTAKVSRSTAFHVSCRLTFGNKQYVCLPNLRQDWTISEKHFEVANQGVLFMNCSPIIRGEQATADVIDRSDFVLYDQAENRLHAQKAILYYLYKQ